jgi:hypothetical protein
MLMMGKGRKRTKKVPEVKVIVKLPLCFFKLYDIKFYGLGRKCETGNVGGRNKVKIR